MKFDSLQPRRSEDIKGIVAPEIGPNSFGSFEKRFTVQSTRFQLAQQRDIDPGGEGTPKKKGEGCSSSDSIVAGATIIFQKMKSEYIVLGGGNLNKNFIFFLHSSFTF